MKMITKKSVEIYFKYNGDSVGFVRSAAKSEKENVQHNDWSKIDNIIQDIDMIKKGICSDDYKKKTYTQLNQMLDSEAIELIEKKLK